MTLMQYLYSTVYRYYSKLYALAGVVPPPPIQLQSAIFINVDFRNPKTLSDVDFRNPKTLTRGNFRNPKTLTNVDFETITEVV